MVKVVVNNEKGLVQYAGSGTTLENSVAITGTDLTVGGLSGGGMLAPTATPDSPAAGATGAVSVTTTTTNLTATAGTDAWTLADGSVTGQLKHITLAATAGGTVVVTPDNFADGSFFGLPVPTASILLIWDGSNWRLLMAVNASVA